MTEKTMIRAAAIVSMLAMGLFGVVAGVAVYNLFGFIAPIVVAVVMVFIIWRIGVESEEMIEYRDKLYWEGVDIANVKRFPTNPGNITDAQDIIIALKERIRDLDAARNEAVNKYYELKERNSGD